MARFHGKVGYGESREEPTGSGIWVDKIVEHPYFGDVIRNTRRLQGSDTLNYNLLVGNSISIVADKYAVEHFFEIKYVIWEGVTWGVDTIEVQSPRLILNLGEVYNGPRPQAPPEEP